MKTQILTPPLYFITSPHICFLIALTLITACSVFKEKSFFQADSLHKQNSRREIKTSETLEAQAVRIYTLDDSSEKGSFTEIFPQGLFTYSAEEGFSGNANRLVINERIKKGSRLRDSAQLKMSSSTIADLKQSDRLLTQTRLKEKEVDPADYSLWYLIGLVSVFAGVYVFRERLKR